MQGQHVVLLGTSDNLVIQRPVVTGAGWILELRRSLRRTYCAVGGNPLPRERESQYVDADGLHLLHLALTTSIVLTEDRVIG